MNILAILSLLLIAPESAAGWALEDVRLLAVSPESARAVLYVPRCGQILIEPGDTLRGGSLEILAVLAGRIVVEETLEDKGKRRRIRAWIEPTGEPGGQVRIRRLRDRMPPEAVSRPPMPRMISFDPSSVGTPGATSPQAVDRE